MRGTDTQTQAARDAPRITPARAGNSFWHYEWVWGAGSPPRVRGTGWRGRTGSTANWITPARAGNSFCASSIPKRRQDHPRACGEQPRAAAAEIVRSGSPPRVRGTDIHAHTPMGLWGSPPRVRGTVCGSSPSRINHGITPARAGNRLEGLKKDKAIRDHPRACGEQFNSHMLVCFPIGSPPRVRGTVAYVPDHADGLRITPARAGNRNPVTLVWWQKKDHPRACGEQAVAVPFSREPPWITPARAGNRTPASHL